MICQFIAIHQYSKAQYHYCSIVQQAHNYALTNITLLLYLILTLTSFVSVEEGGDAVRVLHAYCYMHRLFLEFLVQHPALVSSAKESVRNFIEDPAKRHIDVSLVSVSTRFS